MADRYIDAYEVLEYGNHTVRMLRPLVGLSPVVDIAVLIRMLEEYIAGVNRQMERMGMVRTDLRFIRATTEEVVANVIEQIEQFDAYIRSLGKGSGVDAQMFFPGRGRKAALRRRKPADLLGAADDVLRGLSSPRAAAMPQLDVWTSRITEARNALATVVGDKGLARDSSARGTAGLEGARRDFLAQYKITKLLVRAVLASAGREDEYRSFFLDLQVNEGPRPSKDELPEEGDASDSAELPGDVDTDDTIELPAEEALSQD